MKFVTEINNSYRYRHFKLIYLVYYTNLALIAAQFLRCLLVSRFSLCLGWGGGGGYGGEVLSLFGFCCCILFLITPYIRMLDSDWLIAVIYFYKFRPCIVNLQNFYFMEVYLHKI